MPRVQEVQFVLHQRGVKTLLAQNRLLELVGAWVEAARGESQRQQGTIHSMAAVHRYLPLPSYSCPL